MEVNRCVYAEFETGILVLNNENPKNIAELTECLIVQHFLKYFLFYKKLSVVPFKGYSLQDQFINFRPRKVYFHVQFFLALN